MKLRIIQLETAREKRKTVTNLNLSLAIDGGDYPNVKYGKYSMLVRNYAGYFQI
jgi:hypothetical protein